MFKVKEENKTFGEAFDMIVGSVINTETGNPYSDVIEQQKQTKQPVSLGMRLPSWNESTCVFVQVPDDNSKQTHPYLYVQSRYGRVPWVCTVPEMFSKQWQVVEVVKD